MDWPPSARTRIAVTGIYGFGSVHLRALEPLLTAGTCELVAVADRRPVDESVADLVGDARHFVDADEMLRQMRPDVAIVSTPIPTHAALAAAALRAGAHVLLEKPPTSSLADYAELLEVAEESGRACQVGFQTYGSDVYDRIDRIIATGEIGEVTGIGGVGTWLRAASYYERSPWAGRRTLDGVDVVDGVVTNPLAHAVATALRVDHSTRAGDVAAVEVDLYRAHDIEADDTSAVRIITTRGTRIALGLTTCAPVQSPPRILVSGTAGSITLFYTEDRLEITTPAGTRTEHGTRVTLLENLLAHAQDPATPLLSPLASSGAFMRVLEAVRTAETPSRIPEEFIDWRTDSHGHHPVVADVEHWCERVATERRTFSTLGAPWSRRPAALTELTIDGRAVATYRDGGDMSALDSPRPHLHPVRTHSGVIVTDTAPADHTWHAGVGVAVQDVAGTNLWGGRTYLRGLGYQWRSDHGRIEHVRWLDRGPDSFTEELAWLAPDGRALAREVRTVAARPLTEASWLLDFGFVVHNPGFEPLPLGSPGSNGREGGGYGGFFWRLPACTDIDVRTPAARGEEAVHGTRAPWLAWSARTADGEFTLALAQEADPWFVRAAGYPGVGASLAWEEAVVIGAGGELGRRVVAVVADGRLSDEQVAALLS